MAAEKIGERLKPLLEKLQSDGKEANWSSVCKLASMINVSMSEAAMHPAIDKFFILFLFFSFSVLFLFFSFLFFSFLFFSPFSCL